MIILTTQADSHDRGCFASIPRDAALYAARRNQERKESRKATSSASTQANSSHHGCGCRRKNTRNCKGEYFYFSLHRMTEYLVNLMILLMIINLSTSAIDGSLPLTLSPSYPLFSLSLSLVLTLSLSPPLSPLYKDSTSINDSSG